MSLADLDTVILELRCESIASAIVGDFLGAFMAHNEAARLAAQRDAACAPRGTVAGKEFVRPVKVGRAPGGFMPSGVSTR